MAVEFDSAVILGVDDQRKIGLIGPERARRSIPQKKTAESLTAEPKVNGETADPHCWKRWIAGEASRLAISLGSSLMGVLPDARVW
jgi:hypothetical protein